MARPKSKSALVEGVMELVNTIRNIESQLNQLGKIIKSQKKSGQRGRPPGSKNKGPGRPKSKGRGRGRPPGSKNK